MKKNILISIKLTWIMIVICAVLYPLLIAGIGKITPGDGKGVTLSADGRIVGYEQVGQPFTSSQYFWGRPSAVDYNGAGSAGSNKGPSNPDYLAVVQARIDTFLVYHPGITKSDIPAELVTASGSGLDPHISPKAALIQVPRIAQNRQLDVAQLNILVDSHTEKPLLGFIGPEKINVLKLNIALDQLNP
jgi:K+-transporting ATPase ATPase C chain